MSMLSQVPELKLSQTVIRDLLLSLKSLPLGDPRIPKVAAKLQAILPGEPDIGLKAAIESTLRRHSLSVT